MCNLLSLFISNGGKIWEFQAIDQNPSFTIYASADKRNGNFSAYSHSLEIPISTEKSVTSSRFNDNDYLLAINL